MPLSDAGKNVMLDALAGVAVWASLHDDDPSTTGANELSGGSPAYARKAITWDAADAGGLDSSNAPVFDVPAGDVTHFGLWSASTSGTFYGGDALTDPVTFTGQGHFTLDDADVGIP